MSDNIIRLYVYKGFLIHVVKDETSDAFACYKCVTENCFIGDPTLCLESKTRMGHVSLYLHKFLVIYNKREWSVWNYGITFHKSKCQFHSVVV